MIVKVNKFLEEFKSRNLLYPDEQYLGAFQGFRLPAPIWISLTGGFAAFFIRWFQVILTDQRIFFAKINVLGTAFTGIESFRYDEVESIEKKRGWLSYRIIIRLKNRRKFKIHPNHKSLRKEEGVVFSDEVNRILDERLPQ